MSTTANRYPILSHSGVSDFVDIVVRGAPDDEAVRGFLLQRGVKEAGFENEELDDVVAGLLKACGSLLNSELEPTEGKFCGPVYQAIERFNDEALGDEDFWSYLAVRYFWRFISLRQNNAWLDVQGKSGHEDEGDREKVKLERYIRGRDHYQIPLRMYLRAQAIRDGEDFNLAAIEGGSTDFWRSQVLGVRTSAYPPLARTVARSQEAMQLDIEGQRPAGRRVNRLRANVDFVLHDDGDAAAAISGLWLVTEEDLAKAAAKKSVTKRGTAAKKAPAKKVPAKKAAAKKVSE